MSEGQATLTRDQLMELVADGQRALGQGRADEALMVADSVLESDDKLPAAWALKGDALERQNRLQEALSCYERVIDLKPDSTLDRIRANHLRKLATVDELEVATTPPNRRQAALAAVAATAFFVLVGSAVVLASQPQSNAAVKAEQDQGVEPNNVDPSFYVPPVPNGGTGTVLPGGVDPNAVKDPNGRNPGSGYYNPEMERRMGTDVENGVGRASTGGSSGEVAPANPLPNGIAPNGPMNNGSTGGGNPGGSVNDPRNSDPAPGFDPPAEEAPKKDNGKIIITPSSTGGNGNSTAPPTSDNDAQMTADALVRVARDYYTQGDYAKAAAAYEKALRAGAQPSSTNMRLGYCYKNLGRKAEAIQAFERAIKAYEAEIAAGAHPDVPRQAIAGCQQALRVLRGG